MTRQIQILHQERRGEAKSQVMKYLDFPSHELWNNVLICQVTSDVSFIQTSISQCPNLFKNGQVIHVICMLHIKLIQHFLDNLTCLQSYLVPFLIHLENWRFFQITNFSCQNSKKWAIIKTFLLIIRFWRNLVRL